MFADVCMYSLGGGQGAGTGSVEKKFLGTCPEGGEPYRAPRRTEQAASVTAQDHESARNQGEGQGRKEHTGEKQPRPILKPYPSSFLDASVDSSAGSHHLARKVLRNVMPRVDSHRVGTVVFGVGSQVHLPLVLIWGGGGGENMWLPNQLILR